MGRPTIVHPLRLEYVANELEEVLCVSGEAAVRPVGVVVELHLVRGILLHEGRERVVGEVNLWLQLHSSPSINFVDVSAYMCFMSSYLSITCESPQCPKSLSAANISVPCHAQHTYILCIDLNMLTSWKAIYTYMCKPIQLLI